MIKTARLNIAYGKHTDHDIGMEQVFDAAMKRAGVTKADIWINAGDDYGLNTHFGNWCVVPVRDNDAAARLAKEFGTELDFHDAIFEASDIAQFKTGDKVSVKFMSDFGFRVAEIGRVVSISENGVISILKARSRKIGGWRRWEFKPGSQVVLEKVD